MVPSTTGVPVVTPPNSPTRAPVQRDCRRAACQALGIQCTERSAGQPCKPVREGGS